jgi:NTE family protein
MIAVLHRESPRALLALSLLAAVVALAGCATATRPVNARLDKVDNDAGYRYHLRPQESRDAETMMVLAFSGGGTRAAAFSFGVLEELRRTEIAIGGKKARLLDEVDGITGVSGGSFTALAYGLYGDRLFDEYEKRFLKRDVQSELLGRFLSPRNWNALYSSSWGRSEMAAELYDEILFGGATFGDLAKLPGPMIMVTATDISTGSRLGFAQSEFDLICSDLSTFPLSRAAAASSAVPLVLSPVTLDNYGGTCGYREPAWARSVDEPNNRVRPAGRALQRLQEMRAFEDSVHRPYLHLVDGGLADNLGMRILIEVMETLEASRASGRPTRTDNLKRMVVFVVNSLSTPKTDWDQKERPPNDLMILLKATGVPIDRYSYESVELLKDIVARWQTLRQLKQAGAFANAGNPMLARAVDVPDIDLYAIDVSFPAHPDPAERAYLNELPTSFALTDEQVDRLRAAAGAIMRASPEYQRLISDFASPRRNPSAMTPGAQ